jgi:small conductance mechanosensitive channel
MRQLWEHFLQSFNTLNDNLMEWVEHFVEMLPNIALAIIVALLGYLFSRIVKKYFTRLLRRFSKNMTVNRLLANITTAAFLIFVLFIILSILNLERALQSMLATAGVAGLVVGLALQDPLTNFLSGIIMSTRHYFNVGDLVETSGFFGNIENINLRSTILRNFQGQQVILPNKSVIQNPLTNYTVSGERQVEVFCGISYGDDLEKVKRVAMNAVRGVIHYRPDRPVEFYFTDFGDSSINFLLRYWIVETRQVAFLESRHAAIVALKKAFDENGITIPFPIRTLDFGIKGGLQIGEALEKKR